MRRQLLGPGFVEDFITKVNQIGDAFNSLSEDQDEQLEDASRDDWAASDPTSIEDVAAPVDVCGGAIKYPWDPNTGETKDGVKYPWVDAHGNDYA